MTGYCLQYISDKDTESIGSVDSSSVGIDSTPGFTLEGFEKDAAAHRSQTFTCTRDFGSSSNRSSAKNEPGFEALVDTTFEQLPLESSNNHQVCKKMINVQLFNILQTEQRSGVH